MDLKQHVEQLEKAIDSLGHLSLRLQKQRDDYEKRIAAACGIIDKWIREKPASFPLVPYCTNVSYEELESLRALLDEDIILDEPDQDDIDNFRDGTIGDGMRRYDRGRP